MTTTTTTTTTAVVVRSPNELDYALQNNNVGGGGGGGQQQISLLLDTTRTTSVNNDLIGFSQALQKFKFSLKPLHLGILGTTTTATTRGSVTTTSISKHHNNDEFRHSVIDHDLARRHSSIHLLQHSSDNQMNGSGNTTKSNHSQHHQKLLGEFFQGIGKLRGLQKLELRKLQVDLNHLTLLLQEGPTQLVSLKMEEMKFSNSSQSYDDAAVVQRFVSALQDLPNLRRIQLWIPPNQLQLQPGVVGGMLLSKVALGLTTKLTTTKSNCMISVGPEVHKPRPNNIWEALERQRDGVDLYVNDIQLGTAALTANTTIQDKRGGGLSLLYVIIGPNVHWKNQDGMISSFCQALVQNKTLETLVLYVRPTSAWSFIEQVVSILPRLTCLQSLVIRCSDMTSNNNKMKCLFDNLDHALETNYILRDISVYDMNSKDHHKRQIYHSTKKDLFLRLNYPHGGSGGVLASRKDMLSFPRINHNNGDDDGDHQPLIPPTRSRQKWINQFMFLNRDEDIDGLFYYTHQYMTQIHAGTTTRITTEEQSVSAELLEATAIDTATTRTCTPKPPKQVVDDDDDDGSTRTATTTTSTCIPNSPKQVFDDDGDGNSSKAMTATAEAAAACTPNLPKQAVNGAGSSRKMTTSTTTIPTNPPTKVVHKSSDNSRSRKTATTATTTTCVPNPPKQAAHKTNTYNEEPAAELKTTSNDNDGDGTSRKPKSTTTAATTSIPNPPKQVVVVVDDDDDDGNSKETTTSATTATTTACLLPNPPKQLVVNDAPSDGSRKTITSTNLTSNPPILVQQVVHNETSEGGGSMKATTTSTPACTPNPPKQAVHKNKKERMRGDQIFYVRIAAMALVGLMAVTSNQRGR